MKRKPGLTLERHKEIAEELKAISRKLTQLSVEFSNAYPRTGKASWPGRELAKAAKATDSARCWAEENMFRDCPDEATIHIYYGQ